MQAFSNWLATTELSLFVQTEEWIIPFVQAIHIIMVGIAISSVYMVAARVLGWLWTDQSLTLVVRRFAPWMWAALVGLIFTGVVLIVGEPVRELVSFSFWAKMTLVAIGIAAAIAFQATIRRIAVRDGDQRAGIRLRILAVATMALWLCIIFLGRTIAYDSIFWGRLSPQ